MTRLEIGIVLPLSQGGPQRRTSRWSDIREMALRAEQIGFDTIWTTDELLWQPAPGAPAGIWDDVSAPSGFWEGVSVAGAVAAITRTAKVGTWVMSALHRNAGIIAKTAATLDEISGGRFVFGLGAGHEWPGQARAFGLPESQIFARYEEALKIIIPLLREGHADFEGTWHSARRLIQLPVGPRPGAIPILMGGNGPRAQRLAALHADIYSCYVEAQSNVAEFLPRITSLEEVCMKVGRDPATIGRSAGVFVNPLSSSDEQPTMISGSKEQISESFRSFRNAGFTSIELMGVHSTEHIEALAPVLELVRRD